MISEKDANLAREQHSEQLHELGVHAIAVDEIKHKGEKTFAVIAFVEKPSDSIPKFITAQKGEETLDVPLKVKIATKFKPE